MSEHLNVTIPNVPREALEIMRADLEKHGVMVTVFTVFPNAIFPESVRGRIRCVSGAMLFQHNTDNSLYLELVEDSGHFPRAILIGGIRQMVEEAVEKVQKGASA